MNRRFNTGWGSWIIGQQSFKSSARLSRANRAAKACLVVPDMRNPLSVVLMSSTQQLPLIAGNRQAATQCLKGPDIKTYVSETRVWIQSGG